jgi:hypothetical protein
MAAKARSARSDVAALEERRMDLVRREAALARQLKEEKVAHDDASGRLFAEQQRSLDAARELERLRRAQTAPPTRPPPPG